MITFITYEAVFWDSARMRRIFTSLAVVIVALTLIPLADPSWRLLATHFPATRSGTNSRSGETIHIHRPQTVGPMGYRNVMHVGVEASGIFMRVGLPFGLFIQSIHIPWSEIGAYEITTWPDREDTEIWLPRIRATISFTESAASVRRELERRNVPQVAPQTLTRWRG